jgi:hypothetical protein
LIYSGPKRNEIASQLKELSQIPIEGEVLNTPIEELILSTRAANVLAEAKIITVSDFIHSDFTILCKVPNLGKKTIYEIGITVKKFLLSALDDNKMKEYLNKYQIIENPCSTLQKVKVTKSNLLTPEAIEAHDLSVKNISEGYSSSTLSQIPRGGYSSPMNEISFTDAIGNIIDSVKQRYLPIIKARFGYEDGKCKTLEEIGNHIGITRERVRQILVGEIRRIKHPARRIVLQTIIENIEKLLLYYRGIVSIQDIAKDNYFSAGNRKQLIFLRNLIVALYEERYRIINKHFLTSLSDDAIKVLEANIREAALKYKFPIDERVFIDNIESSIGHISRDYLIYHLVYKEHIEISKGMVLSPGRLSLPQRVKLLLRDIDRPIHFTEIAELYRNHFGALRMKTSDLERAIHTRISESKDFIIVDPGTFILREKFQIPDNIETIVKISEEILRDLPNISDTRYLIHELNNRNVNTGNLNAYSLKSILLEYPGFVSYRKFEIGIEELIDQYQRKSVNDLIYQILESSPKPMHLNDIWKQIVKQRGFPKYAIDQQLGRDTRFIRVAPATYAIAKDIPQYAEKQKIIIDFAKEWKTLKNTAISAFFISEVLKETSEFKDITLSLVEHVLAMSAELVKLPNGFYDLA